MNGAVFAAVYQRDLRLAWRRRTEALLRVLQVQRQGGRTAGGRVSK